MQATSDLPRARLARLALVPRSLGGWRAAAIAAALLVVLPLSVVFSSLFLPAGEVWRHLWENVLGDLLVNTFWLVLGVGIGTTLLGVSLAWLTAMCEFPGRRLFSWALMLPLALPAYVIAFVAVGLFDYAGPVQTLMRDWMGAGASLPPIRSRGGVILVLSLALYPYVYLLARNAFRSQGRGSFEAAQSLGHSRVSAFFRVALPMARPWIAAGALLVLMETLADFGTVAIFNYDTFTTAIYKAWYGLFSLAAAAQLASILVLLVLVVLMFEAASRRRMRYHAPGRSGNDSPPIVLQGALRAWAVAFPAVVLFFAFLLPVGQLLVWGMDVVARDLDARYLGFLAHSLWLGGLAALLTVAVALVLAYAQRRHPDAWTALAVRIATLGYALPGAVLAVGIFIPVVWLDKQLTGMLRALGVDVGLFLQGTLVIMLLAYLVRFLAAAHGPIDSAMQRIRPNIDEASRSFGVSGVRLLRRVHLPLLRSGLVAAAMLVFVDVIKEMPITLMTRPFGWDTLAVRIFEMTSEGEWERAALPALAIALIGLVSVLILTRHSEKI